MPKYHVRFVHKIAPRDYDVSECELPDGAFADRNTLAKTLRACRVLCKGARVREMRVEGDKIVVFPTVPGLTTYWHAVILTPAKSCALPPGRATGR
jgi:hypothetical protein